MGKQRFSDEIESRGMVFYVPAARAFWTGRKTAPDRLRKAKIFYFRVPFPPAGSVPMQVRKARQMLNANAHERFLNYVDREDREFFEAHGGQGGPVRNTLT